jgi:heterodisulfide reductase subunit A
MNCANVCAYGAIEQREICTVDGHVCGHVAYVNPGVCQGCGTCQAVCLSKSVELQTFTDEQIFSEINALCYWE